jgi:hypothetical protein
VERRAGGRRGRAPEQPVEVDDRAGGNERGRQARGADQCDEGLGQLVILAEAGVEAAGGRLGQQRRPGIEAGGHGIEQGLGGGAIERRPAPLLGGQRPCPDEPDQAALGGEAGPGGRGGWRGIHRGKPSLMNCSMNRSTAASA